MSQELERLKQQIEEMKHQIDDYRVALESYEIEELTERERVIYKMFVAFEGARK